MYSLLDDYKKFERIMNRHDGSKELDTSSEYFLAPTTLIPLLCEINRRKISKVFLNSNTLNYVKRITNKDCTNKNKIHKILPKSREEKSADEVAFNLANSIPDEYGGSRLKYHVINELTTNIYDHTSFDEGYANEGHTYAQIYPNRQKVDICVMDDGLSIPGCFKKEGIDFIDECHAISKAITGTSTKKKKDNVRGLGLRSTIKLVVEENQGSALIVSGSGCLHIENKDKYKYDILQNNNIFKGTLISLRINKNEVQNFEDVIDSTGITGYDYKNIRR